MERFESFVKNRAGMIKAFGKSRYLRHSHHGHIHDVDAGDGARSAVGHHSDLLFAVDVGELELAVRTRVNTSNIQTANA